MDTLVSNSPAAMGPGEQQAVHPFFRQDFVAKANSSLPNGAATDPPNISFTYPLASSGSQNPNVNNSAQPSVSDPLEEEIGQASMPLIRDEDSNTSRRKRRKIEKPNTAEQNTTLQSGLSGWLGKEPPASTASTISTANHEPQPTTVSPHPSPHPRTNEDVPEHDTSSADRKKTNLQSDSKRKTLKLNANGRLLSSPPSTKPSNATSSKRSSNNRSRPRKAESKLVIIKYATAGEKNIGETIHKILGGQMVHNVAPKRRTVPASKTQPGKPTHPFFSNKQAQKREADNSTGNKQPAQAPGSNMSTSSPAVASALKPGTRAVATPSVVPRRNPKFPELMNPVWPPRDLVHTRGDQQPIRAFEPIPNDRRKAKSAVVSISDEENALLASTLCARAAAREFLKEGGDTRATLRLPGRHIASGRVLQKAIESQMSWNLPNSSSTANPSIPLIENLRSALLSFVSEFDRGKYESQLWAHKYAPKRAEDVLQIGRETQVLRDWLLHLKITAVDTGKPSKESSKSRLKHEKKQKKRRKKDDELDGFVVSSDEEASEMGNLSGSDDELAGDVTVSSQRTVIRSGDLSSQYGGDRSRLTNAILLSGPPGSGKTASVYAVAKELDFEVFEINPGSRRNARDMLQRVGDMTQNHLVHLLNEPEGPRDLGGNDDSKQNKLMSFFKGPTSKQAKSDVKFGQRSPTPESETKRAREQKQSLILLEEADVLFDEDKQFWTGVLTLISQSRRPIVITCNNESLVPIPETSLHAILRFQKPPRDLAIDYLLLVAASEGHMLKRESVSRLYDASGMDIRRSLMDLNFWCQMGVGSQKAGLDWILSRWPPEANRDQNGDRVRVLSLNTYEPYMGWFNRDLLQEEDSLSQETETLQNTFHWWRLGIQDAEDAAGYSDAELVPLDQFRSQSKSQQLDLLSREADYLDMRSSLDILSSACPMDMFKDIIDVSAPPPPESHRSNYIESYPLLHADVRPEYSALSETVSITFDALLSRVFRAKPKDVEASSVGRIFNGWSQLTARRHRCPTTLPAFQKVFEPIMRSNYVMPLPSGRPAPSFENSLAPITEDIAPYVRAIMAFDGRLKEYRDKLIATRGKGGKRKRTTRASRAALEGGHKSTMRRERWFPGDTNYFWVQSTGMPEWQDILFRLGHFHVQPSTESTEETGDTTSSEDSVS